MKLKFTMAKKLGVKKQSAIPSDIHHRILKRYPEQAYTLLRQLLRLTHVTELSQKVGHRF
ncbi:MAG: hypothetical protein R3B37_12495 [Nitrospira sp.]|nr:hypothetical protein [Nitrospira sp.]